MKLDFDSAVFDHDSGRRRVLLDIVTHAIQAVSPDSVMERAMSTDGAVLRVGAATLDLVDYRRVVVIGFGKASVGMGRAVVRMLPDCELTGVLVADRVTEVSSLKVYRGSHPLLDYRSLAAGQLVMKHAREVTAEDLAIVLISGGGSSLIELPTMGLTLDDLQHTNALLLRSGADITELNIVRKHLSSIKGGRLAEALQDAGAIVTMVISDVVENPLDVIASGPTVPDPTTFTDALAVIKRYKLNRVMPVRVLRHLEAGSAGLISDTPAHGEVFIRQTLSVIADAKQAAVAAFEAANRLGKSARIVSNNLSGEARDTARQVVKDAEQLFPDEMLIYTGETTVTVTGDGIGGRNQEFALAASLELEGRDDLVVLSVGTDGIDGVTHAAGAFGDGSVVDRARRIGLDPLDHLRRNDSHSVLNAIGDTLFCGSTGTNVGDLVLVWRSPSR